MTDLDDDEEYRVWLVWKLNANAPVLVAIDTSEERAAQHVAAVKVEADCLGQPTPETFVEESRANHFYGQSIQGDLASFKIAKLTQKWKRRK